MRNRKGWQQVPISCPCMFQVRGRMGSAIILTVHIHQSTTPATLLGNGCRRFIPRVLALRKCTSSCFAVPVSHWIQVSLRRVMHIPILAAAGLRPRQPRLSATSDCGARLGDFKNLANMAPPLSVPKMEGVNAMLAHFHKTTKQERRAYT